jgi:hypothetical protein
VSCYSGSAPNTLSWVLPPGVARTGLRSSAPPRLAGREVEWSPRLSFILVLPFKCSTKDWLHLSRGPQSNLGGYRSTHSM